MEKTALAGRPLGAQELAFHTIHDRGGLQLAAGLILRSIQQCPSKLFQDACQLVAQRHPLLRMRVAQEASKRFVFEPILEFKVNFAMNDSSSLETVMEKEVMTPLDGQGGSMWKVTYLPGATPEFTTESHPYQITLVFVFSHVIADGGGYGRVLLDFFSFLEQLYTSGEVPEIISRPMPPDILEFADQYLGRKSFSVSAESTLQQNEQAGWMHRATDRSQWRNFPGFQSEDLSSEPGVGLLRARLSESLTKTLVTKTKKEHVTVTSVLTAALSIAVGQMQESEQSEVLVMVTADLRRMAAAAGRSDPDVIHQMAAQSVRLWLRPLTVSKAGSMWKLAAECHEQLNGLSFMTKTFAVLKNYEDPEVPSLRCLQKGTMLGDVGVNNLGLARGVDRPHTAPFKVAEIAGCSGEHYIGKPVNLYALTIDNVMSFSLVYITHMMNKKMAAELLRRFIALLTDVIED